MQNRPNVPLLIFILLLGGALTVFLAIQANSVWVGVLIFVGVVALLYAIGTARTNQGSGFSWGVYIGVIAIAAAVYMSRLAGRFWWTPLFLFISLLFIGNGLSMLSENLRNTGALSVALSIIFFLFSFLGPWLLYGHIAGGPAAAVLPAAPVTAIPRGDFFPGLWQFLLTSIKSGWGILYLAIVILLGRIWFGKWGWLIAPILLILASGVLAWYKPGGVEPLTGFFSTAPLTLLKSALTTSINRFGSAAWGAVFCGIGLVIVLLPAYIHMYSANRAMVQAQKVRQEYGTTIAANLLRGQYTPYTSLVSLITVAASITGFILIWKALSGTAATSGPLEFSLLGVADVSLPRWKPIWQLPYFLNAGVYALISLIGTTIQRRMGLALITINWFLVLLGSFLLSLFVPAGVLNFLAGQSLLLCLVAPLSLLKKTRLPEPEREQVPEFPMAEQEKLWAALQRQMAEQQAERLAPEPPIVEPITPAPYEVEPEYEFTEPEKVAELTGETLVDHGYTIIDMIADPSRGFIIMDDYGDVYLCEPGGEFTELASLTMDEPLGLATISGGRIAAVDKIGKLFITGGASAAIDTDSPIKAFAVNSFGTILAYISPEASTLRGLILAAGKDQLFIDSGEQLTAIAFSTDNRYLGIGTSSGKALIFDMASRKISQTLSYDNVSSVTHIRPTSAGWVTAHQNSRIASWNNQGDLLSSTTDPSNVTCLCADLRTGNIAFGNDLGEITVLDSQFERILSTPSHDEDIVCAIFESSGNSLLTAGIDGTVRRVQF